MESVPPSSTEYQKLSTALCASQLQLAKLCTRNMRCFTQQAIRAREDPASLVASNSKSFNPSVLVDEINMDCGARAESIPVKKLCVCSQHSSASVPIRVLEALKCCCHSLVLPRLVHSIYLPLERCDVEFRRANLLAKCAYSYQLSFQRVNQYAQGSQHISKLRLHLFSITMIT